MNNETRNKLLTHEVPPPAGIWDRIASELDASDSGMAFPRRLHDLEVPAPANAWQQIAAVLESSDAGLSFPRRLQEMEVPAPVHAWQQIAAALDTAAAESPVRRIPWLRYAAAAAIIGLLTWGALSYFNQKNTSAPELAGAPAKENRTPVPAQIDPHKMNDPDVAVTDAQRDDAALEDSKHTFASVDIASIARRHQLSRIRSGEPVELASVTGQLNPAHTYQELPCNEVAQPKMKVPEDSNLATRYVLLMTPDGKLIRISRKWSSMLCCVSGEESDAGCKDQVKEWRARVAGALNAPSSGNFMDIISLVNSLQQD